MGRKVPVVTGVELRLRWGRGAGSDGNDCRPVASTYELSELESAL